MDLVVIHGPPGIGKRTISGLVAKRLGFSLLNLHDLLTPVGRLVGWGTPTFYEVRDSVVPAVVRGALGAPLPGLVTTFIFEPTVPPSMWEDLVALADRAAFVGLTCELGVHQARCTSEERVVRGNATPPETLASMMRSGEFDFPSLPAPSFVVDTTARTAEESADEVVALLR